MRMVNDNSPSPEIFNCKLLKKKKNLPQKMIPQRFRQIEPRNAIYLHEEESPSRKTVIAGLKFYLTLSGIIGT